MKKYYYLCGKTVCIEADFFPGDNPLWAQFESAPAIADINISCSTADRFPALPERFKGKTADVYVYESDDAVFRNVPMISRPGALTRYNPADTSHSETFFTETSFPVMMDNRYMWSSLALAQLMLPQNVFFLHSSFIVHKDRAVLFSAPCKVGKSTQAELWKKFRHAEIINGDKAGVLVEENSVFACGVPFCGTSGICKPGKFPLGAIVLLSQSPMNEARQLHGIEALTGILSNVYLDLLATDENRMILDLLISLTEKVPVYSFACTPDESAVETLEKALQDGGVFT